MDEKLREALAALLQDFNVTDYVYDVRSRAVEAAQDGGRDEDTNSWELPEVKRFIDVCKTIQDAVANQDTRATLLFCEGCRLFTNHEAADDGVLTCPLCGRRNL